MSESIKDRLYQILYGSDLTTTRIWLGLAEIIWGVSLAFPGETFSRSRTYLGMSEIAPEETWAIIWLVSGIIQLMIAYKGIYHTKVAVVFAAFNMALWWLTTTSLYFHVWPLNSVASADLALCLAATLVFIRSGYIPKPIRGCDKWLM